MIEQRTCNSYQDHGIWVHNVKSMPPSMDILVNGSKRDKSLTLAAGVGVEYAFLFNVWALVRCATGITLETLLRSAATLSPKRTCSWNCYIFIKLPKVRGI